ncbi:putative inorganic carbon transporter subunit DabA [Loktanella sp. DJP18]|uniref:putative inorganic carbon transporter subunit DabA n=1 Tax=Loktanella sp. DJP18 TaxID=3409788 RepID=UPI003BB71754
MSWPGQTLELFAAAQAAIDQVPPAFPLAATVAVNPWLGQSREDRTVAAARMMRVGGGRMFLPRDTVAAMIESGKVSAADLTAAAETFGIDSKTLRHATDESVEPATPLPCVADLAATQTGINWPALIEERFGLWAAGHFDRGQAFWPAPDGSAWTSWRAFASRDLTPGLAGLAGFPGDVAATPTDAQTAFSQACADLGLKPAAAPLYFHRLLTTLSGWAQYARHFGWIAARDGGHDGTLFDLLTVRLIWEVALLNRGGATLAAAWTSRQADFAAAVAPDVATLIDAALQEAVDRGAERRLADLLADVDSTARDGRPAVQAVFCIDVRSEVFRRALGPEPWGVTLAAMSSCTTTTGARTTVPRHWT